MEGGFKQGTSYPESTLFNRKVKLKISLRGIPFWRDVRVLRVLLQVLFLIGIFLLAGVLYTNMLRGLSNLGLTLNLDFLENEAGFGISEGIEYDPSEMYLKAFWVGVVNTLKVSLIGIVCGDDFGACCWYRSPLE